MRLNPEQLEHLSREELVEVVLAQHAELDDLRVLPCALRNALPLLQEVPADEEDERLAPRRAAEAALHLAERHGL